VHVAHLTESTIREGNKVEDERIHPIGRHIDTIFRHGLKLGVALSGSVPVKLHPHAAWPFDDGVAADRIIEGCYNNIGAVRFS
jgi:hypothetical protein